MSNSHLPNASTASNYDALNKINDQDLPPTDHTLDWDNPSLASAVCDVAGLTQTALRFWCRLTLNTTTGGMVLNEWHAVWGNVTVTAPVPARVSTGVFTLTLPTTVSNEYDASFGTTNNITVNLKTGFANMESAVSAGLNVSCSGNVITIRAFNPATAAPADFASDVISVFCVGV